MAGKIKGSRLLSLEIGLLALTLVVISLLYRLSLHNTYTDFIPIPEDVEVHAPEEMIFGDDGMEPMSYGEPEEKDGYYRVEMRPGASGHVKTVVQTGDGVRIHSEEYYVSPLTKTIYDPESGGFTGDTIVLLSLSVFWLAAALLLFRFYVQKEGADFYAYSTIYSAGFSLFAFLTGVLSLYITVQHLLRPQTFEMMDAYGLVQKSGFFFIFSTSPFTLAFAAWMAVSNIALLRHERYRFRNVLGLLVSLLIAAGVGLAFFFYRDFEGPERVTVFREAAESIFSIIFVYFECILAGAVICGLRAARHVPAPDRDYILILGCRFRKDGTLTPLLRGRADRAAAFWNEQRKRTGKEAVLIPSGGQGKDEPMPEADAISRYLEEQGIPSDVILPERRSLNTYQNMAFSRELIEERTKNAKVAFCTTNYHVFRSGIWAANAGLRAEGIGSSTKWWFWPNAFVRECVGLLKREWKQELLLLAVLSGFFTLLSRILVR